MADIKHFSLRIDSCTLIKFKYICEYNGRSANRQLTFYIKNIIRKFEKENGQIEITDTQKYY